MGHTKLAITYDFLKFNVWCGVMHNRVTGPFFFAENNIAANIYVYTLQLFAFPQFMASNKVNFV
jgi:hypothetical protein